MADVHSSAGSSKLVLFGIAILVAMYLAALWFDLPQQATSAIVATQHDRSALSETPAQTAEKSSEIEAHDAPAPVDGAAVRADVGRDRDISPFARRLALVGKQLASFLRRRGFGGDYFGILSLDSQTTHRSPLACAPCRFAQPHQVPNYELTWNVFANAVLKEYVPFIVLLFSLYVISGGIRITGDLRAHPFTNAMFLLVGGVLASIIGTTGAAMLLIRPLLETNSERKHVVHTVIFFIFVVCNCGGCLLPLGDPPLFLGYLLGVPFLYTITLWKEWLFVNGLLIAIYYLWDRFWYYPHEEMPDIARDETQVRPLKLSGIWPNVLLLVGRGAFRGLFGSRQNDTWH